MKILICSIEGCKTEFRSEAELSPDAKFVCKNHKFAKKTSSRFQSHQFEKELDGLKKDSEIYDQDWGMRGDAISPSEKCKHGVYDPTEDQRYCSVCNPIKVTAVVSDIKKTKIGNLGIFKNKAEQADQSDSLELFYSCFLPPGLQPSWVRYKDEKNERLISLPTVERYKRIINAGLHGTQFQQESANE